MSRHLRATLAGGRWLARHLNLRSNAARPGQLREAGRPDVAIAAPERQSEVEDFITGSIFRAADLRAAYKKRQEHLDQVRMQEAAAAAARLQLERVEAAALQEAAEAMQKVKELGPCVFIGSSQTAFNERILLAGNFKTILAFNPSIPHCPIVSDVTRICLDHTKYSEHSLAIAVRDASWTARFGNPNAPGNLLIATDFYDLAGILEEDVAPAVDFWHKMSPSEMALEGFHISA